MACHALAWKDTTRILGLWPMEPGALCDSELPWEARFELKVVALDAALESFADRRCR